jgi:tetratricopeptide (TPR) repeat protein
MNMGHGTRIKILAILLFATMAACNTTSKKASVDRDSELVKAANEKSPADEGNSPPVTMDRAPASIAAAGGAVIDPEFMRAQADYHFTVAEAYALDGETAKAIEEYKLTLIYDPDSAQVRLRLAEELVKKGLLVQAVDQAETAVQEKPHMVEARLLLAGLYTSSKLYDKALEQYQYVSKDSPDNIEAALYIGVLLAEEKKYDESIKHFKKLAKDKEHAHLAYYYWGRIENRTFSRPWLLWVTSTSSTTKSTMPSRSTRIFKTSTVPTPKSPLIWAAFT